MSKPRTSSEPAHEGAAEMPVRRRGLMLVLSSPSGAGKTSLARALEALEPDVAMSVSVTTRPARPGENDGHDYRFISRAAFQEMVANGELLEHATVFGHSYGTPRAWVEARLARGLDVLFDIDWQGTQQLGQARPDDLVSVFILPPSMAGLRNRLRRRAQDPEDVVQRRMARAPDEISHWAEYHYVLINTAFERCLEEIRWILGAERLRRTRRPGLTEFVQDLLGQD